MKSTTYKYIILILILIIPVFTQATTTRPIPGEKIRDLQERIQNNRQDKMSSTTLQEKIRGRFTLRLDNFVDGFVRRSTATLERFEQIASRIASRIEKLAATGVDTTAAEAALADARIKIDAAKTIVAGVKVKAEETTDDNLRALYPEIKDIITEAKDAIKAAHAALVEAIRALKHN